MANGTIKKAQEIKEVSYTGTTTGSGNLVTRISVADKIPVTAISHGPDEICGCIIFGSSNNYIFHIVNASGAGMASTACTVTFYYIDK